MESGNSEAVGATHRKTGQLHSKIRCLTTVLLFCQKLY